MAFLIEDINKQFDLDIVDEEVDTIAGWIYSRLTDVTEGSQIDYDTVIFTVRKNE